MASEVKNLAGQTAKATEDIERQIGAMQQAVSSSVDAIRGIGQTIARVSEVADVISSAVAEQTKVTREIADNVLQIDRSATDVASSTSAVNRTVQKTGGEAKELLNTARLVLEQTGRLSDDVGALLQQLQSQNAA